MKKIILASTLAAVPVTAQITGDHYKRMMGTGGGLWSFVGGALFIGLTILVWLWVIKLWKEINKK